MTRLEYAEKCLNETIAQQVAVNSAREVMRCEMDLLDVLLERAKKAIAIADIDPGAELVEIPIA